MTRRGVVVMAVVCILSGCTEPSSATGTSEPSGSAAGVSSNASGSASSSAATGGSSTGSSNLGSSASGSTGNDQTSSGASGSSSGGGTGTSAATSTSSSSGGTTGGAMILPGFCSSASFFGLYDFLRCGNTSDCPCPLACAPDPAFPSSQPDRCESLCASDSDCTDPTTRCVGGLCQLQTCETADAVCSILDAGDGTCLPGYLVLAVYNAQGGDVPLVCESGGSASALCDAAPTELPAFDRVEPQILCPVGHVCVAANGFTFGSCFPVCNPDGGGDCDGGTQCVDMGLGQSPDWGACLPPGDGG